MSEKKETPEINSTKDVAAVLEEANKFLCEHGMGISPRHGISIVMDENDHYVARLTLVALKCRQRRASE